jgi:hypothetical protein
MISKFWAIIAYWWERLIRYLLDYNDCPRCGYRVRQWFVSHECLNLDCGYSNLYAMAGFWRSFKIDKYLILLDNKNNRTVIKDSFIAWNEPFLISLPYLLSEEQIKRFDLKKIQCLLLLK